MKNIIYPTIAFVVGLGTHRIYEKYTVSAHVSILLRNHTKKEACDLIDDIHSKVHEAIDSTVPSTDKIDVEVDVSRTYNTLFQSSYSYVNYKEYEE